MPQVEKQQQQQQQPTPPESVISKFFALGSKPTKETFPELPDVIVWVRFILATAYGIWLGMTPSNRGGAVNLLFGLNFITFVPVLYCNALLGADQESYENKIIFTGVLSSLALMLLIWTYIFTLEHETATQTLLTILVNSMANQEEEDASLFSKGDGSNSESMGSSASSTRETEF